LLQSGWPEHALPVSRPKGGDDDRQVSDEPLDHLARRSRDDGTGRPAGDRTRRHILAAILGIIMGVLNLAWELQRLSDAVSGEIWWLQGAFFIISGEI
jgi:hypothetical protein